MDFKIELNQNETHPAIKSALSFINDNMTDQRREFIAEKANLGDGYYQVCLETWRRLKCGKDVGERYVFGLAWLLRDMKVGNVIYNKPDPIPDEKIVALKKKYKRPY